MYRLFRPFLIIMIQTLAAIMISAASVPRILWVVDLEDPRAVKLDLVYGETLDLECKFRNYYNPLDISGATVILHAVTNGMPPGTSFQVAGTAGSSGTATVRVDVDSWLPQGLESANYTLAVVQTNSAKILRASGTVALSGSSIASTSAPVAVSVYEVLATTLTNHMNQVVVDMAALSNNLAAVIAGIEITGGGGTATNVSLAAAAAVGDFAGTETISPLRVNARNIGRSAGDGATGTDYIAVGVFAGGDASGDFWTAFGRGAGVDSHGDSWAAIGNYAGYEAIGNLWAAIGIDTGRRANWTNSVAIGRHAGKWAQGYNRLYLDVYADEPDEESDWQPRHSATNDAVYIDNGVVNLGRTGQLAPTQPNRLRGDWMIDNGTLLTDLGNSITAPSLSNVVAEGNHTSTNVPSIDTNAVISVRDDNTERIGLYGSGTTRPGVEAYSTYAPGIIARSAVDAGGLFIQGPVSNAVAARIAGELVIESESTANEGAGQPGAITLNDRTITSWDEIEADLDQSDLDSLNAWGRRLPDGQPNAASNTAVVVNSPMLIASGMGFETSGSYAVCITSGAEMQVVTNGGWCCIRPSDWPDGIGFETVTITIPAVANSFEVYNGGTTNGWAQMKFAYNPADTNAPPVVYSTDLLTWNFAAEQQSTHDGTNWTVTVSATEPAMFFKGQNRSGSADRIYSAYPHEFKQGIAVGGLAPVVFDSIITLEYAGKTYRIPAQEIQ